MHPGDTQGIILLNCQHVRVTVTVHLYLEDGCEERPCRMKLIIADEQALVAVDNIQDEALIASGRQCLP